MTHKTIMRMLAVATLVASASSVASENDRARFLRETGGSIDLPPKGCVAVVDCTSGQMRNLLDTPLTMLEEITQVVFKRMTKPAFHLSKTPAQVKAESGAAVVVFVVNIPAFPPMLVQPDDNWGVVNMEPFLSQGYDVQHVQRIFLRVAVMAMGAWCNDNAGILQENIENTQRMSLMELRNIMNHLLSLGITRMTTTTYYQACRDGWAPVPTNNIQRAVWERVQAEKERGPTNPIKIPPPKR